MPGESVDEALPDGYGYAEYDVAYDDKLIQFINDSKDFRSLGTWTKETLYKTIIEHLIPNGCILIIRRSELVACTSLCCFSQDKKIATVMYALVSREQRGHGLGKAMIQRAIRVCQDNGIEEIRLLTDDHRLAAIKTYLRNGFLPVGQNSIELKNRWSEIIEKIK